MENIPLVSIITPCYNSELYISETIESVIAQTFQNWEMLIVDDCSNDDSAKIIKEYVATDPRIHYIKTNQASGAPTEPRNIAIGLAKGRYIAFLDSDDLWLPKKIEEHLRVFAEDETAAIVFSYYEKIDENGYRNNRIILSPAKISYNTLLLGNVIGCLTCMYDTEKVGKIFLKKIGHEDYMLWLDILKSGYYAVNTNTIQALYRVRDNSVSSNKFKALKWQWDIYRNSLKLGFIQSVYCFICYALKALVKAVK